jgi:hypothetical protein
MTENLYTAAEIAAELGITTEEVETIARAHGIYGNIDYGKFLSLHEQRCRLWWGNWISPNEATPPKDGTEFLAYDVSTGIGVCFIASWDKCRQCYVEERLCDEPLDIEVTFWMPILPPDHPIFKGEFIQERDASSPSLRIVQETDKE